MVENTEIKVFWDMPCRYVPTFWKTLYQHLQGTQKKGTTRFLQNADTYLERITFQKTAWWLKCSCKSS
jgi:hypothetical protein